MALIVIVHVPYYHVRKTLVSIVIYSLLMRWGDVWLKLEQYVMNLVLWALLFSRIY